MESSGFGGVRNGLSHYIQSRFLAAGAQSARGKRRLSTIMRTPAAPAPGAGGASMPVATFPIRLSTRGQTDVHDITRAVAEIVARSGLQAGAVTIFCPSSTSGLTTIECEPGCVADLRAMFEELIPSDREYAHNATWDDGNGHSHLRAALLGPSLTVPFTGGELVLGRWQQIVYVDFDIRPRQRELIVQAMGE
jgi:secondary thiamine-phosphate synthase enzyme